MPIDASIPLQIQRPKIAGPADVLSLQDLATRAQMNRFQLAEAERSRSEEDQLRQALGQPGAIDPQTGALSPEGLAAATRINPLTGQKFAQQRQVTLGQLAEQAARQTQMQVHEMQIAAKRKELRDSATQSAVNAYKLALSRNAPKDEALRIYRQTMINSIDEMERSGMAKLAGMSAEEIAQARIQIPDPEQAESGLVSMKDLSGILEKKADNERADKQLAVSERNAVAAERRAAAVEARPDPVTTVQVADPNDPNKAIVIDARTGKKVGDAPPKNVADKALPISASQKLFENQQNLRKAEKALSLIEGKMVGDATGDPSATGWKGYLPDAVLQRTDPGGVETRAAIGDLGSMVIHDRSGAAVSAMEFPRLRPFIPQITDDPATVKKKLENFVRTYREIVEDTTEFYKESGYKVPELKSSKDGGYTDAGSGAEVRAAPKEGAGKKDVITQDAIEKPKIGEVVKGYKYKGGPPDMPSSWEKVK